MSARDENALEPVEPIKQSGAVLRVGRAMLTSGTGSDPVKTATDQVAHGFGLDQHEAHVTRKEITGTSYCGPIVRTAVAEVHTLGHRGHVGDPLYRSATSCAPAPPTCPTSSGTA